MKDLRENQTNRYRKKYKFIKMRIKSLILENAALCDEVARIQDGILIVKDERKFLLYKLLEYENDRELPPQSKAESVVPNGSKSKLKKRHSVDDSGKNCAVP